MLRTFVLGIALAWASTAAAAGLEDLKSDRSYPPKLPHAKAETFKTVGDTELKMYIYEPEGHRPTDRRPAIVFFFGGGWKNGSPSQFDPQCRYLASRGMVAMTADYRVASRQGVKAVSCVADAKSAIRWVRQNAARLGVDPTRIAASGGSAGGHLAAAVGTLDEFDEPSESLDTSSKPNAMILFNPAVAMAAFGDLPRDPEREAAMPARVGVEPIRISPIHHLKAGTPPSLILIGTADDLYPQCEAFAAECKRLGVRCEVDAYDDRPHGFFNPAAGKTADFAATLESTDRFLASLGYLQGEPTVAKFDW